MQDSLLYLTLAGTVLCALVIIAVAGLHGWNGWLAFKRAELLRHADAGTPPSAGARIEVADLKERIRKLEAIAAGVDL